MKNKKTLIRIKHIFPLVMASIVTDKANDFFETSHEQSSNITDITKELIYNFFDEGRKIKFHEGQKQAILNTIYLYEEMQVKKVRDIYTIASKGEFKRKLKEFVLNKNQELENISKSKIELKEIMKNFDYFYSEFIEEIRHEKFDYLKFAYKMATATGKTWVINALIVWLYLNDYSKNFLIIAPGIIVLERLMASFNEKGDIIQNIDLFVPKVYQEKIKLFIKNSITDKDNINRLNDEFILIVNWHIFLKKESKIEGLFEDSTDRLNKERINLIKKLEAFDKLTIINDEAHHLKHDNTKEESKWKKAIKKIAKSKENFFQLDFSATPYESHGDTKNFFHHIMVDFDLKDALKGGIIKLVTLDKSNKNIGKDFTAEKGDEYIELSDGQKSLLRLGIERTNKLRENMKKYKKYPKMMATIEDTAVLHVVKKHLTKEENIKENEILVIHSSPNGEIERKNIKEAKNKLKDIDTNDTIKIILSVLMLKEGFDANSICVIVPLRATESPILLEQTIGRGLRLMFRKEMGKEERMGRYMDITEHKQESKDFRDVVYILEHPKFESFYEDLIRNGIVSEYIGDGEGGNGEPESLEEVKLKINYRNNDLCLIETMQEKKFSCIDYEGIELNIDIESLATYDKLTLQELIDEKNKKVKLNTVEMTHENTIGSIDTDFTVDNLKHIPNYNQLVTQLVSDYILEKGSSLDCPYLKEVSIEMINPKVSKYIKNRMFKTKFNPIENDNYKIFAILDTNLISFVSNIFKHEISKNLIAQSRAKYETKLYYFSEIESFIAKPSQLETSTKSIYPKTMFSSNNSGLEREFFRKMDKDSSVISCIKIMEYKNYKAIIRYRDKNTFISRGYYVDFILQIKNTIYLVETKASKDMNNELVLQKKEGAIEYVKRINGISPEKRNNLTWHYTLLSEEAISNNITFEDMISHISAETTEDIEVLIEDLNDMKIDCSNVVFSNIKK